MGQLGDTLHERRTALGMSLEHAERATRVRARLLEALELGEYDRLPNPGYVRGYISSYARLLELDPLPLLAMYRAETGAGRFHEINVPSEAVAPREQQHAVPWTAAIAVAVVVAIIALAMVGVPALRRKSASLPPIPTTPGAATSTATSTPSPSANPSSTSTPVVKTRQFTLRVEVVSGGASWIKITVDGRPAYEGSLAGGQTKQFQVLSEATVKIGNPSEVKVYRDGSAVLIPTSSNTPTVQLKADALR